MKLSSLLVGLILLIVSACTGYVSNDRFASSMELGSEWNNGRITTFCTTFHIGKGYFVTAAHCVRRKTGIFVVEEMPAEVLVINKEEDIALLEVPLLKDKPWSELRCLSPYLGESLTLVGEPKGYDDVHSFGRVASLPMEIEMWDQAIWVNISAAPGHSGSPLYDNDGSVVAMLVGGYTPWGNLAIAIPSANICKVIYKYEDTP